MMYKLWSICHLHRIRVKKYNTIEVNGKVPLASVEIGFTGKKIHTLFQTQDEIQSLPGILGLY